MFFLYSLLTILHDYRSFAGLHDQFIFRFVLFLVSGIIGGIKSLQNNETLQGLASGLGQMTATMRETAGEQLEHVGRCRQRK